MASQHRATTKEDDEKGFLEEQLEAALEVNRHLAKQVEQLALEVDSLQEQLKRVKAEQAAAPPQPPQPQPPPPPPQEEEQQQPPATEFIKPPLPQELVQQTKDWDQLRQLGLDRGWLIDSRELKLGGLLGEGAFGTTYKATYKGALCAVKAVKVANGAADVFAREVSALTLISHPHVLRLYGACIEPPTKCLLVLEHLSGGSLSTWLYGQQQGMWPPKRTLAEKLRIALDIAAGMSACESHDPPIMHRDLKPANIMLDAAGRARVCDMGLARVLTEDAMISLTPETGSYLYMAPEVVRHDLYLTPADMWSFGVMLVEILTQSRPYAEHHLTPVQLALAIAEGMVRPSIPAACPKRIASLLQAALCEEPMMRPSFESFCVALQLTLEEVEAAVVSGGSGGGGLGNMQHGSAAAAAAVGAGKERVMGALQKWGVLKN